MPPGDSPSSQGAQFALSCCWTIALLCGGGLLWIAGAVLFMPTLKTIGIICLLVAIVPLMIESAIKHWR